MSSRLISDCQDFLFRFRHSRAAIATTAGAIGVICGALVVGGLSKPSAEITNVARNQPVETTGAATPIKSEPPPMKAEVPLPAKTATAATAAPAEDKEASASSYCEQQTWPYITQDCLTEHAAGQRKVRVITTDKIAAPVVSAIETSRASVAQPQKRAGEQPAAASTPPAAIAAMSPASTSVAKVSAAPAPTAGAKATSVPESQSFADHRAAAAPTNVATAAIPAAEPKSQHASTKETHSKNARDKRKREAKRRAPSSARDDDDDAEDSDSVSTRVVERSNSTSTGGRIVERWTEREYDVPSYDGSRERRRVIVRRSNDRVHVYMPSPGTYSRSAFQY